MPSISDSLGSLAKSVNESARRLERLERLGTSISGFGPTGTVTSVGLAAPSWLTVTGSPVLTTGTLTLAGTAQAAGTFLSGPASGGPAAPTFRSLAATDVAPFLAGATNFYAIFTGANAVGSSAFSSLGTPGAMLTQTTAATFGASRVSADASANVYAVTTGGANNATLSLFGLSDSGYVQLSLQTQYNLLYAEGHLAWMTNNTYDIGQFSVGVHRPRNIYAGTAFVGPKIVFEGSTSGTIDLRAPAVGTNNIVTFPDVTGTVVVTPNGTSGKITKFTGATTVADSIMSESGGTLTIGGAATITGLLQAGTKIIDITRTVAGGAIGNYTEIGNFSNTYGAHALRVTLTSSVSGVSIAKEYLLVAKYAQTASWVLVPADKNTGYYNYDFQLVAMQSAAALNLRIVVFRNNNAANIDFNVCIENVGVLADTWTDTSATGSMTVPTAILVSSTDQHAIGGGYMLTRTIPTTVGNYVEIGSFNGVNGNGAVEVVMSNVDGGFVISKRYFIPMTYGHAANWCIARPLTSTGPYSGNDAELAVIQSSTSLTMRILRTAGTTAGTMVVYVSNAGDYAHFWDEATGTGTMTVPTISHQATTFSQSAGGSRVIGGYFSYDMDTMTYATTISLGVTAGNLHKTTTVNATGNSTINASAVGVAGQPLLVLIVNDATSGKVITFGTNFKPNGTLTGTPSKGAIVQFMSDGASWWEVSRTLGL